MMCGQIANYRQDKKYMNKINSNSKRSNEIGH